MGRWREAPEGSWASVPLLMTPPAAARPPPQLRWGGMNESRLRLLVQLGDRRRGRIEVGEEELGRLLDGALCDRLEDGEVFARRANDALGRQAREAAVLAEAPQCVLPAHGFQDVAIARPDG